MSIKGPWQSDCSLPCESCLPTHPNSRWFNFNSLFAVSQTCQSISHLQVFGQADAFAWHALPPLGHLANSCSVFENSISITPPHTHVHLPMTFLIHKHKSTSPFALFSLCHRLYMRGSPLILEAPEKCFYFSVLNYTWCVIRAQCMLVEWMMNKYNDKIENSWLSMVDIPFLCHLDQMSNDGPVVLNLLIAEFQRSRELHNKVNI